MKTMSEVSPGLEQLSDDELLEYITPDLIETPDGVIEMGKSFGKGSKQRGLLVTKGLTLKQIAAESKD